MKGHRDLRLVALATLLCAVLAPLLPFVIVSLPFALPLALFLPGYALTAAIFARRSLPAPQLLLLSLGLSLCVLALGALLLNYVPGGIGPVSWALLLALVTLGSCWAAARRRPGQPASGLALPRLQVNRAGAGLLLGALLCVAAALALNFTTLAAEHADGYTEMWLLPPAPNNAAAGGARVGVTSQEQEPTAYSLRIQLGDRSREVVRSFSLDPGQTRVQRLGSRSSPSSAPVPVRAELFLRDEPDDVYRRVSGWLAAPEPKR